MSKLSKSRSSAKAESRPFAGMRQIQPHASGVDIGAHEILAAIEGQDNTQLVRTFGTYSVDLGSLADWLIENNIQSVAMESTGVYWIPIFETLEMRGLKCCLISATAIKRFPGRKSDVLDCQWIQTLHSYGLLADSFRPEADLIALRTLLRHRSQLIEHRSPHILHMQKAMVQMNIQLSQVLSDITGVTGQLMIRAIVGGERDPYKLAAFRNYRCKKDEDEIAKALTGNWREEHLFILKQSLEMYDFYSQRIKDCDDEIEHTYAAIRPDLNNDTDPNDPPQALKRKPGHHSKNAPDDQLIRVHLKRICGVDIAAVLGIGASIAQTIVSEVGTDMSRFPDEKHFCSWLGLAPHNDISGGKILKSGTLKNRNRAGQAFRHAATSVMNSNSNFGAFYRRLKGRLGEMQALVATAHKIARVVYYMLKFKQEYRHVRADEYEQRFQEREFKYLQRKASRLGFQLTAISQAVS